MHEAGKTLITALIAAALVGAAWWTRPTPPADAAFTDVGEVFAPDFTDPLAARSLEVVSFDEEAARFRAFKVEFDGARWVIPSADNHPADATERMADAAASFIGLRRESVVTDSPGDHESLGVLAPDDDTAPLRGRGTRITIRDQRGQPLISLIVGAPVSDPGAAPSLRYVREAGSDRVFTAQTPTTLSTSLADWIETDLLALGGDRVERLAISRYTIDERTGMAEGAEFIAIERSPSDEGGGWRAAPDPENAIPAGTPVNPGAADAAAEALGALRIVDVRPKPANLARTLSGDAQGARITQADLLSLQSSGFYIAQDGRLLANEGQVTATTAEGVQYTLWFGEVATDVGDDAAAALRSDSGAPGSATARSVMITVGFGESAIPMPERPEGMTDEEAASPNPDGSVPSTPEEAAKFAYRKQIADRAERVEAGRARAATLARRFADWYYLIDGASLDAIRPTVESLEAAPDEAAPGPSDMPDVGPPGG